MLTPQLHRSSALAMRGRAMPAVFFTAWPNAIKYCRFVPSPESGVSSKKMPPTNTFPPPWPMGHLPYAAISSSASLMGRWQYWVRT